MLKRIGLIVSSSALKFSLLSLALVGAAWLTLGTPSKLLEAADESKLYESAVDTVLESAKRETTDTNTLVPINQPEIEQAAKEAFSPTVLRDSSHTVVNAFYRWLQGKTAQPEFTVDLNGAKQTFASKVGAYAETRYNNLPACTFQQLRSLNPNIEPFSVECRVASIPGSEVREKVTAGILSSNDFLPEATFTAQDLPKDANDKTITETISAAPSVYKLLEILPWLLAGVAILAAIAVLYLSEKRLAGIRTVGMSLLGTGVFLIIGSWLISWSFSQLNTRAVEPLQVSFLNTLKLVIGSFNSELFTFAMIYLGVGATLLAVLWHRQRQQKNTVTSATKN